MSFDLSWLYLEPLGIPLFTLWVTQSPINHFLLYPQRSCICPLIPAWFQKKRLWQIPHIHTKHTSTTGLVKMKPEHWFTESLSILIDMWRYMLVCLEWFMYSLIYLFNRSFSPVFIQQFIQIFHHLFFYPCIFIEPLYVWHCSRCWGYIEQRTKETDSYHYRAYYVRRC